jgi:dipeptidyl aminopeptidase/acylaminoacyl peptidase
MRTLRTGRRPVLLVVLGAFLVLSAAAAQADISARADKAPELIPRSVIFSGRAATGPYRVSPDGRHLTYLGPTPGGGFGLWRRTPGKDDPVLITERTGGLYNYTWGADSKHLFFFADRAGDENFRLYAMNIETKEVRDLTPYKKVKAQNLLIERGRPDEVLVGLNLRDERLFDMHRIDLKTYEVKMDTENPGNVRWWLADAGLVVRAAVAIDGEDASTSILVRDGAAAPWRVLKKWPFGETGFVEGYGSELALSFTGDGKGLLVSAALEGDLTELAVLDLADGRVVKRVASHPRACVWTIMGANLYSSAQVLLDPRTREPQAVGFNYLAPEWRALNPDIQADFDALGKARAGVIRVTSRDEADRWWTVEVDDDDSPGAVYLYDRTAKKPILLATTRDYLAKYKFAAMEPIVVKSRDGADIPCYLTLPAGRGRKGLPLVACIHGGPWHRDNWGYAGDVQLFANRGYAVLQVNYRGSDGFGKAHMNAGTGQWGVGRMQDDVTDAVRWAVAEGIADPKRVAIEGGSYGGYAVLAGLAFTPDLYACGIDSYGISDVGSFLRTMPPWWGPIRVRWLRRIGVDPDDAEAVRRISPLYHVDKIKAKLLIFHGANDPRVVIREAEQILRVMRESGRQVEFVVYPDEGHGIERGANLMDYWGRIEEFLAKHLGGPSEPRTEVPGSSAQVR